MTSQAKRRWLRFINPKHHSRDWRIAYVVGILVFGGIIAAAVTWTALFGAPQFPQAK